MEERRCMRGQVLAIPYPTQGHVNPMLQFCKRLASKGLKTTIAVPVFVFNTFHPQSTHSVAFETISDGCDAAGFIEAESIDDYLKRFESSGSKSLTQLITKYQNSENPFVCVVYDAFLPWILEVSKSFGLVCAPFFTQSCAVNFIYYNIYHGLLKLPVSPSSPISIPGLPLLNLQDLPSFISSPGTYPPYFEMVLNQFCNVDRADFVFVNTVYNFEAEEVEAMSKVCPSLLTVGPTIPSFFLDKTDSEDKEYGLNLFESEKSSLTQQWLATKPKGSVIYVSFGSLAVLSDTQMEELALGLKESNWFFLWVVRETEKAKLPKEMKEKESERWLIVEWSSQLEVLSNPAIGCFFTHCGWNSTLEAACTGVPMIAMPQWTDQPTDAKYVEDVWKVGVRVRADEAGLVQREEIMNCIQQVMEGEKAAALKANAMKWKAVALEAIAAGGTTDRHVSMFISYLIDRSPVGNLS